MKLTRIELEQWRQFKAPFAVADLQPGINLFVGPNESGKSTLVEALQAAFFERHKSGTVTQFQPWGDSAAEPAVSLVFEWAGQTWRLDKRFLGRARCDLDVNGTTYTGDEAEEQLTQLMGYRLAGRGTSKPEHHGIPGLLWVQQGTIQDVKEPVEHAASHLQTALGQDLGAVASSSGDWLLAQVSDLRGQLLTKTGRPTGEYKKTVQELDDRSAELQELADQVAAYEEKVDTLARLQDEREQIDAAKPWEAQRDKAGEAKARLDDVGKLISQQEQARRDLAHCAAQQKLLRDKLQGFEDDARQLARRETARAEAQTNVTDLLARRQDIETRQRNAKTDYEAADKAFQQARQQARRQRLEAEHASLKTTLAKNQKILTTLRQLHEDLRTLGEQRQQQAVDAAGLKKLRKLQKDLDKLALRKQVAATRMGWTLDAGKTLTVNGQTMRDAGEQLLLQATDIAIPGVGKLQITPGGKDAGELARDETRLTGDRASLLAELGVQDLVEAEARNTACTQTDAEIERTQTRTQDLAPDGVEAFTRQVDADQARLAALAEQVASCPPAQDGTPSEEDAERARSDADQALKAADASLQEYRQQLGLAEQALGTAKAEWQRLKAQVEDPARQQAGQAASRELTDQKARQETLTAEIDKRQVQIDAANPHILQDDIERFSKSAQALEAAARERQRSIDRLQTELETLGAQGLEEKRGELQQTVDALQRRHAQLAARARALDLLLTLLRAQRQALTRQLQAPLQKNLTHYLQLLFPGAEIEVDENLVPTRLQRAGQHGDFEDLSYGAREQLGLISRLAYADLLQQAGRPTLIILDDALVHADAQRLAQMKRILFDAAKRHQVLLFTCHPANWNDLGVPARDLPGMKAVAA